MFLKGLSVAAARAIALAEEEARRLNHDRAGSEALLLGLLGAGGLATQALKSNNVQLKQARIEVEKIIGRGKGSPPTIRFTSRANRIFDLAWITARESEENQNYLSTKYLLSALIDESKDRPPGVGVIVLLDCDVNLGQLRLKTLSLSKELSRLDLPPDDQSQPGSSFGTDIYPPGTGPDDPSRVPLHRKPSNDTGEIALPLPEPEDPELK